MLGFSTEGWFFFIAGIGVTLLSIWIGVHVSQPKGAQLSIVQRGLPVIDSPRDEFLRGDVKVSFKGQPVPRLSVCRVTIWNSGDRVIEQNMIVANDPLLLQTGAGTVVLDATIETDPQNGKRSPAVRQLSMPTNEAAVQFEFLNPGEGFVVRVLHTCTNPTLQVLGSLKGARIIGAATVDTQLRRRRAIANVLSILIFIAMFLGGNSFASLLGLPDSFAWLPMVLAILFAIVFGAPFTRWFVLLGQPRALVTEPPDSADPLK